MGITCLSGCVGCFCIRLLLNFEVREANNERIQSHLIEQLHAGAIASCDIFVIDSTATSVSLS